MALLAVVLDRLPSDSAAAHILQVAILLATTLFAIWMIAFRHIYQHIIRNLKTATREEDNHNAN